MSAKHTPGPWAAWQNKSESGSNYWRIRTAPEKYGLQDNLGGYCGEANARLIAAAPDLLEALQAEDRAQWAIRNLEAFGADPLRDNRLAAKREVEVERTRANFLRKQAIAKAEGRKP
jgi:hypothetical protein